jgi:Leucine-rich repeat (LRR) protein
LFGTQFGGCIPKEIGKLACLTSLTFNNTSFSSSIPSEIGQLSKLKYLCLLDNLFLDGQLPGELNNLVALKKIDLFGTPNVVSQSVMTHGSWDEARRWSSI